MIETKCSFCNTRLGTPFQQNDDGNFCNGICYSDWLRVYHSVKKRIVRTDQKHEEIKRMAWEVICHTWRKKAFSRIQYATSCGEAWRIAKQFYNFAKEKEENENA